MNDLQKRTWAEVSLENLRHNYMAIRAALPAGCRFLGIVKADAYGHGDTTIAHALQRPPWRACLSPRARTILPCPALMKRWSFARAA